MKIYLLVGLVCCILATTLLTLDISTYVDYAKWLSVGSTYLAFNPSPNLMKLYTLFSIDLSSIGITLLIIHFKKWNENPVVGQVRHKK